MKLRHLLLVLSISVAILLSVVLVTYVDSKEENVNIDSSAYSGRDDEMNVNSHKKRKYMRSISGRASSFSDIAQKANDHSHKEDSGTEVDSPRESIKIAIEKRIAERKIRQKERNERIAKFLDEYLEREGYDKEWAENKVRKIETELENRDDIGSPSIISTTCKSSICRLEVGFTSTVEKLEFYDNILKTGDNWGSEGWIWAKDHEAREIVFYMARSGEKMPSLPDNIRLGT